MILIAKILESYFDSLGRRILKVTGIGKNALTATQANNFGFDSNPIKGMSAIYSETLKNGKSVIIGYINRDQLAEIGESRVYSVNAGGELQTYVWLKNNGDILLGGDADNAVRHAALNSALQTYNNLIKAELAKIAAAITVAGGSYVIANPSIDISSSKADKIKTP